MADIMTNKKSSTDSSAYFSTSWSVYRKVLKNNYMGHVEAYQVLSQTLISEIDKPFSFLDLACGDAYYSSRALRGTKVTHYTGIDLSEAALQAAREELQRLECEKELKSGELNEFDSLTEPPLDVIWVGLSLHHLDTEEKAGFIKKVYESLSDDGIFLIYEPVFLDGEHRGSYFKRIKVIIESTWTGLSDEETGALLEHVRTTELPETEDTWIRLGRDAGLRSAEKIFSEPIGLYSLFIYRK